jgi:hypothetical protein
LVVALIVAALGLMPSLSLVPYGVAVLVATASGGVFQVAAAR